MISSYIQALCSDQISSEYNLRGKKKSVKNSLPHRYWASKISPEYSMEGLMLKLKLQYFGHLM